MVRALLASGRRVAAWNRTPERAQALAADGADVVTSAAEAMTAAPLVILCVSTTADVRQLLDAATPGTFDGRTLLNVTSGTPEDARGLAGWAQEHGIRYLDAAIGAYPEQLGTTEARLTVAGDEALYASVEKVVLAIGGSSIHVGPDHAAANAIDCAMTGAFYISSLVAFMEATRFVRAFGVSHDVLADLGSYSIAVLDHQAKLALDRIAADDFTTDQATLTVYADAAAAFAAGLAERGDAPIARTTAEILRRAVDAGLGDLDIAAVVGL